jgi:hypothetical protein
VVDSLLGSGHLSYLAWAVQVLKVGPRLRHGVRLGLTATPERVQTWNKCGTRGPSINRTCPLTCTFAKEASDIAKDYESDRHVRPLTCLERDRLITVPVRRSGRSATPEDLNGHTNVEQMWTTWKVFQLGCRLS